MPTNKSSGYIHDSRSAIPKPKSTIGPTPPRNQTKVASIRFTQEELSRRAKGSAILRRPGGPKASNRS